MTSFKRYMITAALPYANGPVHIGHLAGVYIPADIYVRYLRLRGRDVKFVCGSDEHGVPITLKARQEGVSPQDVVDKYHNIIKKSFEEFGVTFDIYSRTSSPMHHETAAGIFKTIHDKGGFVEKTSEQYFDEDAGQFLADRYIIGTCPKCGFERAYGDQCESCGTSLSPTELINPQSTISGSKPVLKETKHWYLPLDQHEAFLKEWILDGKKYWKSNVYGQCKSWIDQGLQPRAVSRDLSWGVPVPLEEAQGKVLYVWFDAPIGYISATKELAKQKGFDWELYWKDKETRLIHFIGKDNIVFHCIVFPSMLKAEGSYILPENVPANEFLNLEGDKISTSRNWAVWLHEYLVDFKDKQDVLRYALTASMPETKDNDFSWKDFQDRNNNELVAILGNFVNRAMVLTHKYFQGLVPAIGELTDFDKQIINEIKSSKEVLETELENFRFREALKAAMNVARLGNKYLADTEPWKLIKTDENRVKTILNVSVQIIANLSVLLRPFLPFTAIKLADFIRKSDLVWDETGTIGLVPAGHQLAEASLLFDKIEDEAIEIQRQKLLLSKQTGSSKSEPLKENISYDDFMKMDIRTATILEAERVPKTKKLLKLKLDAGIDQRTVVSGIAEYFDPEKIIGQKVCLLANLEPRNIKGIDSKGMILMAENPDGSLRFVVPQEDAVNGGSIK